MTAEFDDNSLNTILGSATVVSLPRLKQKYPNGKIPRNSPDNGKMFVCRRGVTARTATYTDEFLWEDFYHGVEDVEALQERINSETQSTRGHKPTSQAEPKDLDFVVPDDEGDEPQTPKKRPKPRPGTPKSQLRTPSKLTTPATKR